MKILLVRHAKAEDKTIFARSGRPDAERPLTKHGKKEMRRVAKGLKSEVPRLDRLVSSPLLRARQTADILHDRYGSPAITEHEGLAPGGNFTSLLRWIRRQKSARVIALVGHEPDLSRLLCWFLDGGKNSFVRMKKPSAALLEFASLPQPGGGILLWHLKPSQLEQL